MKVCWDGEYVSNLVYVMMAESMGEFTLHIFSFLGGKHASSCFQQFLTLWGMRKAMYTLAHLKYL